MKYELKKSVTMKGSIKTTPYFSAYPLKALNLSSPASGNNSKKQTTKLPGRLRILPMINPYSEKTTSINKIKIPAAIQPADNNWFNNYE